MTEYRNKKISYTIRKQLSLLLQKGKIKDFRINKIITITRVEMSKDLRKADIYFSTYEESKKKETLKGLKSSVFLIRKLLFKNMRVKYIPIIYFYIDEKFDKDNFLLKQENEEIGG